MGVWAYGGVGDGAGGRVSDFAHTPARPHSHTSGGSNALWTNPIAFCIMLADLGSSGR